MSAPTLALCMIVRDEEAYLEDCLASVRGVVDEIVIVDTGSTDGTLAIAERHGARVSHFPWIGDFAAARNAGIEQVTSDWILVLDADERLLADSIPELRRLLRAEDVAGYSLVCENLVGSAGGGMSQHAPVFRLFRNGLGIRFDGLIHEQAIPSAKRTGRATLPSGVRIRHLGYLAEAVTQRGKRERNLRILERQATLAPDDPFAHFNLAEGLKLLDRFIEAERHYLRALDLLEARGAAKGTPYYPNLYLSLGDLYRRLLRFERATAVLDEAIARYPDYPDLYYIRGFCHFDAGAFREAIPWFERCLGMQGARPAYPTDPDVPGHKALRALADCHIRLGDRPRARAYLEQTLALHPAPDAALHVNLGILLSDEREDAEAIRHFEAAIARDAGEPRAWLNLAMQWLQAERYEEAAGAYARCPNSPECRALLVLAHALTDRPLPVARPDEATLVASWCAAAELALTSDRTAMVQALLDRLDSLGETLPSLDRALGETFLRGGLAELAAGALLRAQQRTPEDPVVYRLLGDACQALGEPDEARTMYAKAASLAR
ncbi:MAG TPA: glycosyltransferase [Pantanalinema sp.]